jgi:hypothetical protein
MTMRLAQRNQQRPNKGMNLTSARSRRSALAGYPQCSADTDASEVREVNRTSAARRAIGAVAAAMVLAVGCGRIRDSRNPDRRSPSMVLLDGATGVTYYLNHDGAGHEELEGLTYHVSVPYPGAKAICAVTAALARDGWRPIARLNDDTGSLSSHLQGWRVRTRSDGFHIDGWDAEWVNDKGEQLSYSFTYGYPSRGTPDRSNMQVGGIRTPARYASRRSRGAGPAGTIPNNVPPHASQMETIQCSP